VTEDATATDSLRAIFEMTGMQGRLLEATVGRFEALPESMRAAHLAERLLEGQDCVALAREEPAWVATALATLCGIAPFLALSVIRHPDWLSVLLERGREGVAQRVDLDERLAALRSTDLDPTEAFRRFKYFEFARITLRDCDPTRDPGERTADTLAELSQLADVVLSGVLELAKERTRERHGEGIWRTPSGEEKAIGFVVLGLGKLGSEELNYSSDVDVVYVYEGSGEGHERVDVPNATDETPTTWYTHVAQEFGRILQEKTVEGFLYRVDIDLRPQGAQGPLVVSEEAMGAYYEAWADTWERAAFMKARPVAGDLELGWRTIRDLAPMLYRSAMDVDGVRGIRSLKQKVEEHHGERDRGFNVKIDPGGIRDIEFLVQANQLLHGGRIPQIRGRSTRGGLQSLAAVGLLEDSVRQELEYAYLFLRRLENRLQMEAEGQRHMLPPEGAGFERAARVMELEEDDPGEALARKIEEVRQLVRKYAPDTIGSDDRSHLLDIFQKRLPRFAAMASGRVLIEGLAGQFARAAQTSADPERVLVNLDRFLAGIGERRFFLELLLDRPELVSRLTTLFVSSQFLSTFLASHPRLIEPVFADPEVLLLGPEALRKDLRRTLDQEAGGPLEPGDTDLEPRLDALRLFHHRQFVNIGLLDVAEEVSPRQVEEALTDLAEVCVEAALEIARALLAGKLDDLPPAAREGDFVIIGMGKLASRELSYGSDLDLIFLYDLGPLEESEAGLATAAAQQHFVSLTQRFISTLQTKTREGDCYEIDARLRPSGNQGALVTSLRSFEGYHARHAQSWERQALLRSRAVAGSPRLMDRFEELRRQILAQPPPEDLSDEIHRVRSRMEKELAKETRDRRDFKTGRGGALDVETIVQLLCLRHGSSRPRLLEVRRVPEQVETLEAEGLLTAAASKTLREGWSFLQRLGSRLRIVENRSISDLHAERGDLDGVARRLGYAPDGREGSARRALLADYARRTDAIRSVYLDVLGVASGDDPADGSDPGRS